MLPHPPNRVTSESLQQALHELLDMFAHEFKRCGNELQLLDSGETSLSRSSTACGIFGTKQARGTSARDVKMIGKSSCVKEQKKNKLRVCYESGFGHFIRGVGKDYLAEQMLSVMCGSVMCVLHVVCRVLRVRFMCVAFAVRVRCVGAVLALRWRRVGFVWASPIDVLGWNGGSFV